MRLVFVEDASAEQLNPVALLRPVFELLCGRFSLRERMLLQRNVTEWGALIRPYLVDSYREAQPTGHVNDRNRLAADDIILVNGRWMPGPDDVGGIAPGKCGTNADGEVIWLHLSANESAKLTPELPSLETLITDQQPVPVSGQLIEYPWHLIEHNPAQLTFDFRQFVPDGNVPDVPHVAVLGPTEDISVADSAVLDPFVVLDARHGPITIDEQVHVQSFTRLEGPCHIGAGTQLFRALIREGTTIGPVCRIGGEIEESIFHGYSNKYHEGFIGHSYVCPWVNLGAITSNSDLKNDYSAVKVPLSGTPIDTGSTKVGSFIGDHTKTAIDSMFNTGSSIGIMSMVLPGGRLLPKHIPSFCRIWFGNLEEPWDLERSIETARTSMGRRSVVLSKADAELLRHVYTLTAGEREAALDRARSKRT